MPHSIPESESEYARGHVTDYNNRIYLDLSITNVYSMYTAIDWNIVVLQNRRYCMHSKLKNHYIYSFVHFGNEEIRRIFFIRTIPMKRTMWVLVNISSVELSTPSLTYPSVLAINLSAGQLGRCYQRGSVCRMTRAVFDGRIRLENRTRVASPCENTQTGVRGFGGGPSAANPTSSRTRPPVVLGRL